MYGLTDAVRKDTEERGTPALFLFRYECYPHARIARTFAANTIELY